MWPNLSEVWLMKATEYVWPGVDKETLKASYNSETLDGDGVTALKE